MGTDDDRRRYEKLWADHQVAVLGYLLRRVADREDAANLLAEAFLVAWRRLQVVPTGGGERPYLYGVAAHVLANGARSRRRRQRLTDRIAGALDRIEVEPVDDQVLYVRAGLAQLPLLDREVLTLAAWEGLSASEIGQVLHMSATAVSTRQSRARSQLRQILRPPGLVARSADARRVP